MKHFKIILVILLMGLNFFAHSQNKVHHIVGVDGGYASYPGEVGFKGESNLNYFFIYKKFIATSSIGIAPFTNFGTITKFSASVGLTTNVNKRLSWHFLFGGTYAGTSKERFYYDKGDYYTFWIHEFSVTTGFNYRIKNTNLLIGLNSLFTFYGENTSSDFGGHGSSSYPDSEPCLFLNLSLNYKFKFKQNEN